MTSAHTSLTIKSAMARLLATENIQVNQTNSKTAWFDVERRLLNLPLWDVEPYVYDMLVGHEVGHALYTPAEGWHQSVTELGIPRSYVNVVEDARIERLVKNKYPGMIFTFDRAYKWMHTQDFFGVGTTNLTSMKLIDRINLHFKVGSYLKVPFADIEMPMVQAVAGCETFEDVVRVSKEILAFWKENKTEIQEELEEMTRKSNTGDNDDYAGDDDFDYQDSDDSEEYGEEGSDGDIEEEDGEDEEDRQKVSGQDSSSMQDSTPDEESDTDNALRQNESRMTYAGRGGIMKMFTESVAKGRMVSYKEMLASPRDNVVLAYGHRIKFDRYAAASNTYAEQVDNYREAVSTEFKKFMVETNRAVSYMVKEFEQKKAAYQYSRAKVSNSGVLNTSSLHKYKFSEDVFKRITTLANAKSHGMIISIDMSGSMTEVILDTIKQALNLALFCRRVNIPFEMYGFTDGFNSIDDAENYRNMLPGTIDPYAFRYLQFFGHKMSKYEFETACKNVFQMACGIYNEYDSRMGSTPTNEMLIALSYRLKAFRKETGVQKVMNIVLTDGEPNRSGIHIPEQQIYNLLQVSPTKVVRITNTGTSLSTALMEYIREECGVTNIGYFLGDSSSMKNILYRLTQGDYNKISRIRTEMRANQCYSTDNVFGYDRYIIIRNTNFGIQDEEFTVASDAKKSTLAREFSKFAKGKRTSRVLLDRFVQAIV